MSNHRDKVMLYSLCGVINNISKPQCESRAFSIQTSFLLNSLKLTHVRTIILSGTCSQISPSWNKVVVVIIIIGQCLDFVMVDNHSYGSADGDTFFIVLLPINYQSKVEQASKKLGTQR